MSRPRIVSFLVKAAIIRRKSDSLANSMSWIVMCVGATPSDMAAVSWLRFCSMRLLLTSRCSSRPTPGFSVIE